MEILNTIVTSGITSLILNKILPSHDVKLEYITKERSEWRIWIREKSAELLSLMDKAIYFNKNDYYNDKNIEINDKINEIIYGITFRMNPNSYRDQLIIDNLKSMQENIKNNDEDNYKKNRQSVVLLISQMLKDEWERAKKEVKNITF